MRGKDLLECIENIDDTLIEEALNPKIVLHRSKAGACLLYTSDAADD